MEVDVIESRITYILLILINLQMGYAAGKVSEWAEYLDARSVIFLLIAAWASSLLARRVWLSRFCA